MLPKGNYVEVLMLASLVVEAWDFSFVFVFIREQYNPMPLSLGLTAAAVQAGAAVGARSQFRCQDSFPPSFRVDSGWVIFQAMIRRYYAAFETALTPRAPNRRCCERQGI
jgi:hypothetical protein